MKNKNNNKIHNMITANCSFDIKTKDEISFFVSGEDSEKLYKALKKQNLKNYEAFLKWAIEIFLYADDIIVSTHEGKFLVKPSLENLAKDIDSKQKEMILFKVKF